MDVKFLTVPTPTESYTDKMAKTTEITNSNNFSEQLPPSLGFTAAASPGHVSLAAMREVIFRSAAMQPIHIDPESYTDKMAKTTEITNSNNFSEQPPPSLTFTAATSPGHVSLAAMREVIFRSAAMQPIHIDPEAVKPPKRRNVRISKDPQSVAARHRRERISERIRILQRLVPGGTKMDTASMLEEAVHYMKFLKTQLQSLERAAAAAGIRKLLDWQDLNYPGTTPLIPCSFAAGEYSTNQPEKLS